MLRTIKITFLLIAGFSLFTSLNAQSSFFELGGAHLYKKAGIISTSNDASSIYFNPAGLTNLTSITGDISYNRRYNLAQLSTVSLGVAKPTNLGVFGASVVQYGYENYSETKAGLTYARKLFDILSVGATFDYLRYDAGIYGNKNLFTFEVGAQTQITESLTLGVFVFNPGNLSITENRDVPGKMAFGLAYQAGKKVKVHTELSKTIDREAEIKIGLDYQIMDNIFLSAGSNFTNFAYSYGVTYYSPLGVNLSFAGINDQRLGSSLALSVFYQKQTY